MRTKSAPHLSPCTSHQCYVTCAIVLLGLKLVLRAARLIPLLKRSLGPVVVRSAMSMTAKDSCELKQQLAH